MRFSGKIRHVIVFLLSVALMMASLTGCGKKQSDEPLEGWEIAVQNGEMEILEASEGGGSGTEKWEADSPKDSEAQKPSKTIEESQEETTAAEAEDESDASPIDEAADEPQSASQETEDTSAAATEENSEENEESESSEDSEQEADNVPAGFINPLTGETVSTDMSGERPYVFCYNNHYAAMPQLGISGADMIFEFLMESSVTTMAALFSQETVAATPVLGSIWGARGVDLEAALGYDGIMVNCGADDQSTNIILREHLDVIDQILTSTVDNTFFRDLLKQTHGTEHSLFAIGENVAATTDMLGYRTEHESGFDTSYGLIFTTVAKNQCTEAATDITVTFAGGKTSDFHYDESLEAYILTQYGKELRDGDENPITNIGFANVINIYANTYLQSNGIYVTEELTEGEGTFFTKGRAAAIKWYKNGAGDTFHFTLENGTPLQLSVGKTYVCVNQTGRNNYQGYCTWE